MWKAVRKPLVVKSSLPHFDLWLSDQQLDAETKAKFQEEARLEKEKHQLESVRVMADSVPG
jgi:hypothetical protein